MAFTLKQHVCFPETQSFLKIYGISLASKDVTLILLNSKVHHHVDNSGPLVPYLDQTNTVYNLPLHFFKIHFNITLPSVPRHSHQYPILFLSCMPHAPPIPFFFTR